MPDLFVLFNRWWKQIAAITILAMLGTGIIVFMQPRQYMSETTSIPAANLTSDKARIFSEQIQSLYSDLGTADDVDRIVGTAELDTVYIYLINKFDLYSHYQLKDDDSAKAFLAVQQLKANTKVFKSSYGELKVRIWDKDKNLAAALANAMTEKLKNIHQDLQNSNNELILQKIKEAYDSRKADFKIVSDSLNHMDITKADAALLTAKRDALLAQVQEYEKLLNEYQLICNTKPQVFTVIEKAKPAYKADRPKRLVTVLVAMITGFVFSFLLALVLEGKRTKQE
ncbi:MAG: hypothetical protein JSU05_04705 [Bacteroidetes bacterium]|nr:hypothetical protein [Bacteroidota bacterium]